MNNNGSLINVKTFLYAIVFFFGGITTRFVMICEENDQSKINHNQLSSLETIEETSSQQVVHQVITASEVWRPIQDKVKDTVVQIISHMGVIDLLQPFKPPMTGTASGGGFFILFKHEDGKQEEGYIITNSHVVNQAQSIWIQIPSLGKRIIDVDLVGLSPARDLALLKVNDTGLEVIRNTLGKVPFLPLGDSDTVKRSNEVLALGYPLGQRALKSTTGVVSGREGHLIQISAPINPGSSGGPLLNYKGEVIGINTEGITEAQNIGYAIPINDLKLILSDLHEVKLLRKPFLGILFSPATEALTDFLGNPQPGGCYVVEVIPDSPLAKAGVKPGDMIYKLNENRVDIYGEMSVNWSEDKLSVVDFASRLSIGDTVDIVWYRKGKCFEKTITFDYSKLANIRTVYPGYEDIDYEIFGGMIVMELTKNHISLLGNYAQGLARYLAFKNQREPILVITHVFPNSELYRSRTMLPGTTLNEINGIKVKTLDDFRKAVKMGANKEFFTILGSDNVKSASDNIFTALRMSSLLAQEPELVRQFRYKTTPFTQLLLQMQQKSND
jgi:serine protease Do